ncbi:globin-coupled sensor protein [Robertmurraya massiliosenegalensis]|uniref:globin-coupled sensor protein n=1 Tax=Robertmurraya massiliosenegalensis TaxID=1287657 RepID=UPI000307FCE3|nr:globin-coupled sensor protein [Robertmurraya massiliosenegalensis]
MFRHHRGKAGKKKSWRNEEPISERIIVSHPLVNQKVKMLQLTKEDLYLIAYVKPLVEGHIETLVDEFYKTILQVEELKHIIETNSSIERLRKTLHVHLVELFNGMIDEPFIQNRLVVAKVHYRIGLNPSWYMGAFQNLQHSLFHVIFEHMTEKDEFKKTWGAITKLLSLEQQLVLEAYNQENDQKLESTFLEGQKDLQQRILEVSDGLITVSEETNASVESLISSSHDVSQLVVDSYDKAKKIREEVQDGQELLTTLVSSMKEIENDTQSMRETVQQLEDSSEKISKVVEIVHAIADQTNLLALNSAIEAARAGEHGKGFAVVSQEVKKLAEQTKNSIGNIQQLVVDSQTFTGNVTEVLTRVEATVQKGSQSSNNTNETFQTISHSIEENENNLGIMDERMEELVKVMEEIGEATEYVAASAEKLNQVSKIG